MLKTLRESKAKLSELVEAASRGEDVLITVRGKVKARLTRAGMTDSSADRKLWMRELRRLRASVAGRKPGPTVEEILNELRADRT